MSDKYSCKVRVGAMVYITYGDHRDEIATVVSITPTRVYVDVHDCGMCTSIPKAPDAVEPYE